MPTVLFHNLFLVGLIMVVGAAVGRSPPERRQARRHRDRDPRRGRPTRREPVRMDWLTPTRRAVRWSPMLVAVGAGGCDVGAGSRRRSTDAVRHVDRRAGDDGGRRGVRAARPGPRFRARHARLGRDAGWRIGWSCSSRRSSLGLLAVRWLAATLFATLPPAPGWKALAAFGAAGVAACATLTRRLGPRAVDAAVVGDARLAGRAACGSGQLDVAARRCAMPWWRWPVAIASVAVLVTVVATTRGVEA